MTTVRMKKVLAISTAYKTKEEVQIFRNMNGIVGSFRGLPSLAASDFQARTNSRMRTVSASSSSSSWSLRARRRWSRDARYGMTVPDVTATTADEHRHTATTLKVTHRATTGRGQILQRYRCTCLVSR